MIYLVLNTPLSASGNPVPGRWQKVIAVASGTKIIVYTKDGSRLECHYQSIVDESMSRIEGDDFRLAGSRVWVGYADSSHDGVFVSLMNDGFLIGSDTGGSRHQIELSAIDEIVLPKTGEYSREGAIWGAMGGAMGGALISVITFNNFTPLGHLLMAGAGAGIGALGGGITGATLGSSGETIYISPGLAREKTGK